MSLSGIKKAAVYDPATKTVVRLDKLLTDGGFTPGILTTEDSVGNQRFSGIDCSFDCRAADATGYAQLETWMKNRTPVKLVVLGIEENLLWYEPAVITVKNNYDVAVGKLNGFTISIKYKGGSNLIKTINNLVLANSLWQDANADGKVDAFTFQAGTYTASYANDEQVLTAVGVENKQIYALIEFPIAGADITSSFVSSLNQNTLNSVVLQALDKDSNVLASTSLAAGPDNLITPASTYYLKYVIDLDFTAEGNVTKFTVPGGINY